MRCSTTRCTDRPRSFTRVLFRGHRARIRRASRREQYANVVLDLGRDEHLELVAHRAPSRSHATHALEEHVKRNSPALSNRFQRAIDRGDVLFVELEI